jgi:hypothetical protein
MGSRYLPFVDTMKAAGMALIVYGHVAAGTWAHATPPVYAKQIGVAFFVFLTGFTLSRERRTSGRTVYNRYFEILFFGVVTAVVMSAIGVLLWGDPNESNYMPLVLGVNVFMNDFPPNPTTWYIGTYLHILLLWVAIRRVELAPWMIAAGWLLELGLRATVMQTQGLFVAYMFLPNWLTVFLIGLMFGRQEIGLRPARGLDQDGGQRPRVAAVLALLGVAVGWPLLAGVVSWELTFPFMTIAGVSPWASAFLVSLGVSFVYLSYTLATYYVALGIPAFALTQFIARNTIVVFIAHMPVYYLLEYLLLPLVPNYAVRVTIEFLVCLPVLALFSEYVRRVIRLNVLRDQIAARFEQLVGSRMATSSLN